LIDHMVSTYVRRSKLHEKKSAILQIEMTVTTSINYHDIVKIRPISSDWYPSKYAIVIVKVE
jgi:hypothetical protein